MVDDRLPCIAFMQKSDGAWGATEGNEITQLSSPDSRLVSSAGFQNELLYRCFCATGLVFAEHELQV